MVQISNSLIIAAAVVPALTAPVLDVREPFNRVSLKRVAKIGGKVASGASLAATVVPLVQQRDLEEIDQRGFRGLRQAGKIAGKVASGVSLAATVAPLVQQRDLEAREPRITSAQAKAFAKGAGEIAHHAKSGVEFGAAVAPLFPHKQRREFDNLNSGLEIREPRITRAQAKAFEKDARKFTHHVQSGIEFGAAVAPLVPQNQNQNQRRSLEDLESRKFHVSSSHLKMGGGAAAAAAGFAGTVALMNTQPHRRDINEIATRAYEDTELDARDPKFRFSTVFNKVAGVASNFIRDEETGEIYVREEPELDARDPKFRIGSIFKKVAGVASNFIREDESGNVYVREFDDAEIDARDFDEAEIDARDPKFRTGPISKKVVGVASNFIRETPEIDQLD